ncbi:DinB family protein [Holophaga foetida]|uniref:DinB family protein n=1 Tax=Holophaga foetida TaxID=35839 RepID=UPI000247379B|nr:DinB family protein [Holophaga foetida]
MLQIPAPPPGTFAPYHAPYLALVPPESFGALLQAQPGELATLLAPLDGDFRYAEGKWSIKEVVGHITDTERIQAYRLLCFARGEKRSLLGFDQDAFVAEGGFSSRSLADLTEEFRLVRQSTLALLRGLPATSLERLGQANEKTIGVAALAYLIPGHAAHHIQILRERYH